MTPHTDTAQPGPRSEIGPKVKRDIDTAMKRWDGNPASVLPIVQLRVLQAVNDRLEAARGGDPR